MSGTSEVPAAVGLGTPTAFAAGAIIFSNGMALAANSASLFWDNASGILDVNSGSGRTQIKKRTASDIFASLSTGSSYLYLSGINNQDISLTFYQFGQLFGFTGDGTGSTSRSVLEFQGNIGGGSYAPIMTMVVGTNASEHEVHVARNPGDTDAIIHSYTSASGPAIFTETAQSATIDFGVRRIRVAQVGTTFFGSSVDATADLGGASTRWANIRYSGQLLAPNGTAGAPSIALNITSGFAYDAANGVLDIIGGGTIMGGWTSTVLGLSSASSIQWGSGTWGATSTTLALSQDASGVLAVKNGSNQETIRVYGNATKYLSLTHDGTNSVLSSSSGLMTFPGSSISVGTNPAQSEAIRVPNATGIVSRNAANNADIYLVASDGSNNVFVGFGDATTIIYSGSSQRMNCNSTGISFFGVTPVGQATGGQNVTNNVTDSGSTAGTIPDITDGVTYANDYTNLRRALYQLARMLKQDHDQLRALGILT